MPDLSSQVNKKISKKLSLQYAFHGYFYDAV